MTPTLSDPHSDTRIFVLSALGSLLLHGLLVAGLASIPKTTSVEDEPPTVQVTLLPAAPSSQTTHTPPEPIQPKATMHKTPLMPMPSSTRIKRSQTHMQPLQASLTPPLAFKQPPLRPPVPAKPILQDIRASQAMKAREMMKMRVPKHAKLASPSLPTGTTRIHAESRRSPSISPVKKKRVATRLLPALPRLATPQILIATSPTPPGSTMTRPTIISSSRPIYPRVARESGWEGTVVIRTHIDTHGIPSQVNIQESCGHPTLDQAAQDAVKRWAFQPAKDGNIPITKWVDIPIKFDLNS